MSQEGVISYTAPSPSRARLEELFVRLARLPSPSRAEREVADYVGAFLRALGLEVSEDEAGRRLNGDAGNLYCLVRGEGETPVLALGTHLDTVAPQGDIEPVLGLDGVFRNVQETILGADDKCAIAAVLHATELLVGSGYSFPTYELIFTVCEEVGLQGAKHLPESVVRSPLAVVLDSSGPVGGIVVKAPGQNCIRGLFKGLAAHAGVEPERGRNAIQAASRAVAAMRLGRLDEETTANIGVIRGGVATNIVPDRCEVEGECRSHDEEKLAQVAAEMVDALQLAAASTEVDVEVQLVHEYSAFALSARQPAVRLAEAAVSAVGLKPELLSAGGGSDANVLNARGIPTVNLAAGMMRVHSPEEFVSLDEIERLCAVVLNLVRLAPLYAPRRGGAGERVNA